MREPIRARIKRRMTLAKTGTSKTAAKKAPAKKAAAAKKPAARKPAAKKAAPKRSNPNVVAFVLPPPLRPLRQAVARRSERSPTGHPKDAPLRPRLILSPDKAEMTCRRPA